MPEAGHRGVPLAKGTETGRGILFEPEEASHRGVPLAKGTETWAGGDRERHHLLSHRGVPLAKGTETSI